MYLSMADPQQKKKYHNGSIMKLIGTPFTSLNKKVSDV